MRISFLFILFQIILNTELLCQVFVPNSQNPQFNFQINPANNLQINPEFTSTIHPKFMTMLNPRFTASINPDLNPAINPQIQPQLNPDLNTNYSPDYNAQMSPFSQGSNRKFIFDTKAKLMGLLTVSDDKKFMYGFDLDLNKITYWVSNSKGGFNEFETGGKFTGSFAVPDGMGGLNVFDENCNWIYFIR